MARVPPPDPAFPLRFRAPDPPAARQRLTAVHDLRSFVRPAAAQVRPEVDGAALFGGEVGPVADERDIAREHGAARGLAVAGGGLTEILQLRGESVHPVLVSAGELPPGGRLHF